MLVRRPGGRGPSAPVQIAKTTIVTLILAVGAGFAGPLPRAAASPYAFSYGGRLADTNDNAIQGPVNLELKFYRTTSGGAPIGVSAMLFNGVALSDGVFQLNITQLAPAELSLVLDSAQDTYVEVTDHTHNVVYPRQHLDAVPFAMKVPVDGTNILFNSNGALTLGPVSQPGANQFLTKDNNGNLVWGTPATGATALQGQTLSSNQPQNGQVLSFSGGQWLPTTPTAGSSLASVSVIPPLAITSSLTNPTISLPPATSISSGYLAASDWITFNTKVNSSGGTLTGSLNLGGYALNNIGAPLAASDAATKQYVDTAVGQGTGGTASLIGGLGDLSTTPASGTLRGSNGAGSNIRGSNLYILAGNGTGSATSGAIVFATSNGNTSGTTPDTLLTRLQIQPSGNIGVGTTNPASLLDLTGAITFRGMSPPSGIGNAGVLYFDASSEQFMVSQNGGGFAPLSGGGGGTTTITAGSGLSGGTFNSTGTVSLASVGTAGNYSKVTTDSFGRVISGTTLAASDLPPISASVITSGMLAVGNGGTGASAFTNNGVLVGSGVSSLSATSAGSQYNVLTVNGSNAPVFGSVLLSSAAAVTGTLPVGNGGTGLTAGNAGGIPYFSSTSALASSASLAAGGIVLGGGAGNAPTATTLSTGQLLIGTTGSAAPQAATLGQGANQGVTIASNSGSINLSTVQDIRTTASPTFAGLVLPNGSESLGAGTMQAAVHVVGTGDGTGAPLGGVVRGTNAVGSSVTGAALLLSAGFGTGYSGSGPINFQVGSPANSNSQPNNPNVAMTLAPSGSVGIGSMSPMATLDVVGTANVSGTITTRGLNGLSTTLSTGDTLFFGNSSQPTFYFDRPSGASSSSFAFNANTSAPGSRAPVFTLYNNNSSHMALMQAFSGATGGVGNDMYFYPQGNSGKGNVGIGTNAPTSFLHTYDNAAQTNSYTGIMHSVQNTSTTSFVNKTGMDIESTGTWNGSSASNTGLLVNATNGTNNFGATFNAIGSSNNTNVAASFSASGGNYNYAALFNSGNVGIGSTYPAAALDVTPTSNIIPLQVGNSTTTSYAQMKFNGTGHAFQAGVGNGSETSYGVANKFFILDATQSAMRMTIDSGGNVGIGTTSPAQTLDLGGGNIKMGYNASGTTATQVGASLAPGTWSSASAVCTTGLYVIGASCWANPGNGACPWAANSSGQLSAMNCSASNASVMCTFVCANIR